jgi:Uma2 family endonuclease
MAILVLDPFWEHRLRAEREATDSAQYDEVWDGLYVIVPVYDNLHQQLALDLAMIFHAVVPEVGGGDVLGKVNVSDRVEGWEHNYREPDVTVVLNGGRARNCDTHFCGGPDFLVEVLTAHDRTRDKLPFYGIIGVRELLILDRDPWALELYGLRDGQMVLVDRSDLETPASLASEVLPLVFRLVAGEERPMIEVTHRDGQPRWLV